MVAARFDFRGACSAALLSLIGNEGCFSLMMHENKSWWVFGCCCLVIYANWSCLLDVWHNSMCNAAHEHWSRRWWMVTQPCWVITTHSCYFCRMAMRQDFRIQVMFYVNKWNYTIQTDILIWVSMKSVHSCLKLSYFLVYANNNKIKNLHKNTTCYFLKNLLFCKFILFYIYFIVKFIN